MVRRRSACGIASVSVDVLSEGVASAKWVPSSAMVAVLRMLVGRPAGMGSTTVTAKT